MSKEYSVVCDYYQAKQLHFGSSAADACEGLSHLGLFTALHGEKPEDRHLSSHCSHLLYGTLPQLQAAWGRAAALLNKLSGWGRSMHTL